MLKVTNLNGSFRPIADVKNPEIPRIRGPLFGNMDIRLVSKHGPDLHHSYSSRTRPFEVNCRALSTLRFRRQMLIKPVQCFTNNEVHWWTVSAASLDDYVVFEFGSKELKERFL